MAAVERDFPTEKITVKEIPVGLETELKDVDSLLSREKPDLIINTITSLFLDSYFAEIAKSLGLRLVTPTELDLNDSSFGDSIIRVKSPSRMLAESVRDVVDHFELEKPYLRVLFDEEYRHVAEILKKLLSNGTEFLAIEEDNMKKQLRRIRKKPQMANFVVVANIDTMSNLTNAVGSV